MPRLDVIHNQASRTLSLRLHEDIAELAATVPFDFDVAHNETGLLRWYVEEFDPAGAHAADVAGKAVAAARAAGSRLYSAVFDKAPDIGGKLSSDPHLVDVVIHGPTSVPWELMRDPSTDRPLAVIARSFTRAAHSGDGYVAPVGCRVLVVVSRPGRAADVPFRSVARHIVHAALDSGHRLAVEVLRPPSLAQLRTALRAAAAIGMPYSAVHFDGHGVLAGPLELAAMEVADVPVGNERRGYLLFEGQDGPEAVTGEALGALCGEFGVGCVILNACRSADEGDGARATASVARELLDSGVAGVVAMRYALRVSTAAAFMRATYSALFAGADIAVAATAGRRAVETEPGLVGEAVDRLGWVVPVVHGPSAAAVVISPGPPPDAKTSRTDRGDSARDEVILEIDRAFDRTPAVVLSGWAGSGKSTVAKEFAEWFAHSGAGQPEVFGLEITLDTTQDDLHRFAGTLHTREMKFTLSGRPDRQGRDALNAYARIVANRPTLWIWHDVDVVSLMPYRQRMEILAFLRYFRHPRLRILALSSRDDRAKLADDVTRVDIGALDDESAIHLAVDSARAAGHELTVPRARSLVVASGGLPEVIRHASTRLADPVPPRIAARFRDLLARCFDDDQRTILGFLVYFHRYVSADTLSVLLFPQTFADGPEIQGRVSESVLDTLDLAAETGLVTTGFAIGYRIHPCLPDLLPSREPEVEDAWLRVMARMGNELRNVHEEGYGHVVDRLVLEEDNLLALRSAGMWREDWELVIQAMQALRVAYARTHRVADWARLLDELGPLYERTRDDPQWRTELDLYRSYQVERGLTTGDIDLADRHNRVMLDNARPRADELRRRDPDTLDRYERAELSSYAVVEEHRGRILQHGGDRDCLTHFQTSFDTHRLLSDGQAQAVVALMTAEAHLHLDSPDQEAQRWVDIGLELINPHDSARRHGAWTLRGEIHLRRLQRLATADTRDVDALDAELDNAVRAYRRAAADAPTDRQAAVARVRLGGLLTSIDLAPELAIAELDLALPVLRRTDPSLHTSALIDSVRALLALHRIPEASVRLRAVADNGAAEEAVAVLRGRIDAVERWESAREHDPAAHAVLTAAAIWRCLGARGPITVDILREMTTATLGTPLTDPAAIDRAGLSSTDGGYTGGEYLARHVRHVGAVDPAAVSTALRHIPVEHVGSTGLEMVWAMAETLQGADADRWWTLATDLAPDRTAPRRALYLLRQGHADAAAALLAEHPDATTEDGPSAVEIALTLAEADHWSVAEPWLYRTRHNPDVLFALSSGLAVRGRVDESLDVLREAARAGVGYAFYLLAMVASGIDNTAEASDLYRRGAHAGHAVCMVEHALVLDGGGDRHTATGWLHRAVDAGDTRAMFLLGGYSIDADDEEAAERWWRMGAEHGEVTSMTFLGAMLADRHDPEAETWLRTAAGHGDPRAMHRLADLLKATGRRADARQWRKRARQRDREWQPGR